MKTLPRLLAELPNCRFSTPSIKSRHRWLWLCFALSQAALALTALPVPLIALLSALATGYAAQSHCSIKRQPALLFTAMADGRLAQRQGEGWQLIELTRHQRWPFAVLLEYRIGMARHTAFVVTSSLSVPAHRALNRGLAAGKPRHKKLPAILTNPVL
jgi:hypothetical protein